MSENIEELRSNSQPSFDELITDSFVNQHSKFATREAFKNAAPEMNDSNPDNKLWNEFIRSKTDFENWNEMQKAAYGEYSNCILYSDFKDL